MAYAPSQSTEAPLVATNAAIAERTSSMLDCTGGGVSHGTVQNNAVAKPKITEALMAFPARSCTNRGGVRSNSSR